MSIRTAPIALALTAVAAASPVQPAWDNPRPVAPDRATVAHGAPVRLVQSTGNLYWTAVRGGRAVVFRTSKDGLPGQERAIYSVSAARYRLGAVTYARAGTSFRFWVAVTDRRTNRSWIRQFAGPGQRTIISPRPIGDRDLATNGRYLFWADTGGIRRVPAAGGTRRTIFAGAGLRHVGVGGNYLYFSQGKQIFRTDLNGGGRIKLIPRTTDTVTAMHVRNATVYYGLRNGLVRSRTGLNPTVGWRSSPTSSVTSISHNGATIVWSWCARTTGNNCTIRFVGRDTVYLAGNKVHDVQGDLRSTFYANSAGVQRR
ncbi:hypothetical protein OWR29_12935 [Actinoplanes sp. Pm04-4]|uniref:DUF5050 domain-containing protein n=1 Tax=Paractinoplanes pyxinae TaxID=2997416 RepID=A0ABT4AXD4_9ACTN|nr:hypothetical protein [Actinoplanes pyxinae]MCY1138907.1 hypothetical protein [Actinoplanes pyxinae]